jgi:hypothetical protein
MSLSPTFFIVGAPKAGTTALHSFLDHHPQVVMSEDKEPNYFSWQEIESQALYYKKQNIKTEKEYLALFQEKSGAVISGEASVSYLFYPSVAQRIKNFCPEAKIIISLREPVARALSHYQMDYSLGLVKFKLEDIWKNEAGHPVTGLYHQQYFQISDYLPQVKQYLNVFPRQQIHFFLHEDLIAEREKAIHKICDFLGIEVNHKQSELEQRNVTLSGKNKIVSSLYANQRFRQILSSLFNEKQKSKVRSLFFSKAKLPALSPEFRNQLHLKYANSLQELSGITGLNLDNWKTDTSFQPYK